MITVSSGENLTSGSLSAKLHSSIYEARRRRDSVRGVDEAAASEDDLFRSSLRDGGQMPRGVVGRDESGPGKDTLCVSGPEKATLCVSGAVDENFLLVVDSCPGSDVRLVSMKEKEDVVVEETEEDEESEGRSASFSRILVRLFGDDGGVSLLTEELLGDDTGDTSFLRAPRDRTTDPLREDGIVSSVDGANICLLPCKLSYLSNASPLEDMNEIGDDTLGTEGERREYRVLIGEEGAVEENCSFGLFSEGERDRVDGGGYSFMNERDDGRETDLPLVREDGEEDSPGVARDLLADVML